MVILVPETTRFPTSSGSFGNSIRNGLKIDIPTIAAIARDHGRGDRDAQHPHHSAMPRGDRKARLETSLIGRVLNRVHRCSEALRITRQSIPLCRITQPGHSSRV